MIHDETTTEFELPMLKSPKKDDNVVRVKFSSKRKTDPMKTKEKKEGAPSLISLVKEIDLSAPWLIRLLAVLAVLVLSMLVL